MATPKPAELIESGVHIGHKKSRWNPRMAPYVFGVRNSFHIIDLFATIEKMEQAAAFLADLRRQNKKVLFVGVTVQSRDIVQKTAESLNMPYVVGRWIGGLFTNFAVVGKRITYFKDLEKKQQEGKLEKYTKREQLHFKRQIEKMRSELGGVKDMEELPAAIVVSDVVEEEIAVNEARVAGIPVVGIVDTNGDPTLLDYPIPANNSARSSLERLYGFLQSELSTITPAPREDADKKKQKEKNKQKSRTNRAEQQNKARTAA